jgi:hypothetical protein
MSIAVDATTNTYTLTINQPTIAAPFQEFLDTSQYPQGGYYAYAATLASGDQAKGSILLSASPAGSTPHYVSIGEWGYSLYRPAADDTVESAGGYFAFGSRTVPGDIPTSGTATYSIQALQAGCDCYGNLSLAADFAARTMAANLLLDGFYGLPTGNGTFSNNGYVASMSGSGVINAPGDFNIALSGSATMRDIGAGTSFTGTVNGTLFGALFGPAAVEAGGVFDVVLPDTVRIQGAFSARRN